MGVASSGLGQEDSSTEAGGDASKRASRFDFAKRKESDSFMTASPLRTELMQGFRDGEGYGAGKDATSLLGSVFDQDNGIGRMNGLGDGGAAAAFGLNRENGGFPGMGLSSRLLALVVPDLVVVSVPTHLLLASLRLLVVSSRPCSLRCISWWQQPRQRFGIASATAAAAATTASAHQRSGVSFLAELQQQAAQRAQQQAQFASGNRITLSRADPTATAAVATLLTLFWLSCSLADAQDTVLNQAPGVPICPLAIQLSCQ